MILDYSTARPSMAALHAMDVTAVGRYIGWDSVPGFSSIHKNLLGPEKAELLAAHIEIFLSFEYAAKAALNGTLQGVKDGALANQQMAALGFAGHDMSVYYAIDFDLPDFAPGLPETPANAMAKLGPVAAYFKGIHTTKPNHSVDAYGGYYAIKRLFNAGLIKRGWQTLAWSGTPTQWDPRALIKQQVTQVLGGDINILKAASEDFGQWPRPPVPAKGPFRHVADGTETWVQIAAKRGAKVNPIGLAGLSVKTYTAADWEIIAGLLVPKGTPYYTEF